MKDQPTREHPKILAAAERQMQTWAMAQEIAERAGEPHRVDRPHGRLGPYITLSRETGAGGGEIAEIVGRRLGWEVLDKNLVDCVAQRYRLSRSMLELVDETNNNWVYDLLGSWFDRKIIPHEKYFVHLTRVVIAAARLGNVVIVGRGAHFILPRDQGLSVRIVASEKYRVQQVMRRHGLSEAKARAFMAELDRGRKEFAAKFFHRDLADPRLFDLILATDRIGPERAAEVILEACRQWNADAIKTHTERSRPVSRFGELLGLPSR